MTSDTSERGLEPLICTMLTIEVAETDTCLSIVEERLKEGAG